MKSSMETTPKGNVLVTCHGKRNQCSFKGKNYQWSFMGKGTSTISMKKDNAHLWEKKPAFCQGKGANDL